MKNYQDDQLRQHQKFLDGDIKQHMLTLSAEKISAVT